MTLCLPQPVAAQNNAAEVSAGYSFLSNDTLAVNQSTLPFGFFFGSGYQLTDTVSLAFDLNGHFKRGIEASDTLEGVVPPLPTEDFQAFSFNRPESGFCSPRLTAAEGLCDVSIQTVSAVAGPRFHLGTGRARPFVHIMAGLTRSLRKIAFFAHTSTNFTIQPGGGIDVDMSDNTAFRIQADYRRVMFGEPDQTDPGASLVSKDGEDYQDFTFSVGVVFKIGQR
ncbi:MAG: outer membrane beta-barrel protein [Acidobacteria bacterium]|nr:outer membrane beta-barrel protein [Acidobacteriota bacterium]